MINYIYWNISDDDMIENIKLILNFKYYLVVDEGKILIGEKLVNEGILYDFVIVIWMGDVLV